MDPVGVVLGLPGLIATLVALNDGTRLDWEEAKVDNPFLGIFDISFSADRLASVQRSLDGLPTQERDTCRFYIYQESQAVDGEPFMAHVGSLGLARFFSEDNFMPQSTTWSPLNTPLQGGQTGQWHMNIQTFGVSTTIPDGGMPWHINRVSRYSGTEPPSFLRTSSRFYPGKPALLGALLRCHLRVRNIWHDDGRMLCFISGISDRPGYNATLSSYRTSTHHELLQLCRLIIDLDKSFSPLASHLDVAQRQHQHDIIMLRICYAILLSYINLFMFLDIRPDKYLKSASSNGKADILPTQLSFIMKDRMYWEQVYRSINVFKTAVGSFLESASLNYDQPDHKSFRALLAEIRGAVAEVDERATSFSARLQARLDLLQFSRSIYESGRLQLLSLLAAIFLPLSLAASILSMQTRFADLGYLLYDFFGVITLLGTLTGLIVVTLKLITKITQQLRRQSTTMAPWLQSIFVAAISFNMFVPWALVLSSFLIGMFKSVSLGIKILGAGLGLMIVALLGIWGLLRFSRDDPN